MTPRRQMLRLAIVAALRASHVAAFLGGYYYGRLEGMQEYVNESKAGDGWWDTAGPVAE